MFPCVLEAGFGFSGLGGFRIGFGHCRQPFPHAETTGSLGAEGINQQGTQDNTKYRVCGLLGVDKLIIYSHPGFLSLISPVGLSKKAC